MTDSAVRAVALFPAWLHRLGFYALALLLVAAAALVREVMGDVLNPAPFLVFYLAWVVAAAFGGLGPGLLATVASWLCVGFFFDTTPGHIGLGDPESVGRFLVLMAGGLAVSVVGEKMRRARLQERRQAEELAAANAALRASEQKYRFLVENAKDVTWATDLQGRWTFISSNVEKVAGYRADEIMGKTIWDFLAPECHDLVKEKLAQRVRGGDLPPYEVLMVGKDGRRTPFEVHAAAIRDDAGNIVGVQGVSRDITERQQAEAALRESEKRYRGIVEDQTELICLFEEDQEAVKAQIAALNRENPFVTLEQRVWQPDGSFAWQEWKNRAIFDGQGHLTGYQAVGRDITKRKRAEAALRESEAGLAAAQRLAHIGSWQWDIVDDTARWSDETFRIFGLARGPLQEHRADFVSMIVPEDRQRVDQALSDALSGARDYDLDYRIRRPDGQERVIHAQAQVWRADDGRPVMMHGTIQDITERQQVEDELRESEEKYRRIVETATEAIVMIDAQARIVFVNDRWSEIVGYRREEAGQMTIFDLVFPEDLAVTKQRWESRKQGRQERYEFRLRRKDGSAVWALISMAPRFSPEGNFLGELIMAVDITQRQRAEEALRRSEARLNRSQEIAHLGSWELDLATNRLSWSEEVYRIFGLAPREFGATYEAFLERVHPDDRQAVDDAYAGSIREGRDTYEIEHRIIRKDTGEVRTVHEKCEHFRDAGGTIVRSAGMVHDITERQRAEAALRASEERFRRMAESIDEIFFIVTPDWRRPIYVSPGYERMFGLKAADLDRDTLVWLNLVVPEDRPVVRDLIERQARGEVASRVTVEFRIMPRDGSTRWLQANTYPILDDQGNIQLITGTAKDITERKQAEEGLAESRKKYRGLVEKINDWIWEIDANSVYTYSSPRALELLGYAPEEILGKTPFDLMPPEEAERVWNAFQPIWHERQPFELLENTLLRKDGRRVTVETSGMPMFSDDGAFVGYTGVDRDVTSRKQAEEALRQSEEKYRALVENSLVGIGISKGNQIVYANRSLLHMFGYEDFEEFAATPLLDHLTPASRAVVEQWGQRALRGEELPVVLEHDIVRPDGTIRTLQLSVSRLSGEDDIYMHTAFIDITERKQAEEALRESEEKFRLLAETSPAAILIYQDGKYVYVNPAAESITGYSRAELLPQAPGEVIHPDYRQQVKQMAARRAQGEGTPTHYELKILTKDGQERWVDSETVSIRYGNKPAGLVVAFDITERKRAEQDLRESRNKYQALIETTADFIWEMDASGKYTYCSPQMKSLWGYEPKDMIGKTPFDVMPPEDREQALGTFMSLAQSSQPFTRVEASSYDSQGRLIAVESSGVPFFDADGRLLGYRGISRDITARKRAEEALRSSQSMLQSVMENVPQGIFWKDLHSTYLGCNHVFAQAVGLESPEEIVGKTDYDLPWSPEQTALFREYDRRVMDNDAAEYHVIEQQREASGKLAWIETNKVPLHDAQGHVIGILGTYEDITERKQAEEALREWNATLESRVAERTEELEQRARQLQKLTLELSEAEERERERVAAVLHDDLQQVLAAAKFQVSLLSGGTRGSDQAQEVLGRVKEMLKSAIEKSRSLSHELSPAVLRQGDLAEAFDWLAEQMQARHGLTVRVEAFGAVQAQSDAVKALLYRSAQEMLFNVVKHAEVSEARVRVRRRGRYLCLSVSDRGRGFEPREIQKTAGLGLRSIRERVALLGGRMKARSAKGRGTAFRIIVPDAELSADGAPIEPEATGRAASDHPL